MRRMRLKIGQRLALGYGMVIALLIATTLVGVVKLRGLSEITSDALNDKHPTTVLVNELIADLGSIARAMRSALLLTEPEQLGEQMLDIGAASERLAKKLTELKPRVRNTSGQALLAEIDIVHSAYVVNQEDFVNLLGQKKFGEARNLLIVDLHGYQESYFVLLGQLSRDQEAQMAAASAEVQRSYEQARLLIFGFAAAAVLLSVTVTLLITRYLLRKLGGEPDYAASIAREIAVGNLSPGILIRPNDHSSLLFAMSAMRDALIERDGALRSVNQELVKTIEMLRQTQSELVRSEKIAALGSLVAGVAHEMNTPIGNCILAASTIAEAAENFRRDSAHAMTRGQLAHFLAEVDDGSALMLRNINRAADLVTAFKKIAVDKHHVQGRAFLLADTLAEARLALADLLEHSACELAVDIPADLEMRSYPGPLAQVLGNLISNAIAHGYEGQPGPVEISARRLSGERIEIVVRDRGQGIAAEHLPRIFDPFFTTKLGSGSTGLGLHVSYNIVTGILAGHIDVASEAGSGTTATLILPTSVPGA